MGSDLESVVKIVDSRNPERKFAIYPQPLGGTVHHYHDSNDLEADLIVQ